MTMKPHIPVLSLLFLLTAAGAATAGEPEHCDSPVEVCLEEFTRFVEKKGWAGIKMEPQGSDGFVVTFVWPGSPAAAAGFRRGDLVVAFQGLTYAKASKSDLKKAYEAMVPGKTVTYSVRRGERQLVLPVLLVRVPPEVAAQWIGQHMLEAHVAHKTDPPRERK